VELGFVFFMFLLVLNNFLKLSSIFVKKEKEKEKKKPCEALLWTVSMSDT
jgi:hypothetical protein